MVFGSTFSGVGGLDLGLQRAGHSVAFQIEINAYRRAVLERHWPGVPRFEDVRDFDGTEWRGRIDGLCGGFPCQDVSKSGRQKGLAGERSGLFFEFARIAHRAIEPGGFLLLENVPGLLASHAGRDFAHVLATLAELGFCDIAWRILDSQHFGVPQRRRRVFILARRDRGRSCATVLLEPEGGGGDFEALGRAPEDDHDGASSGVDTYGQRIAGPLGSRTGGFRTTDLDGIGAYVGTSLDANRVRTLAGSTGRVDGGSMSVDPTPDTRRYGAVGDAVTVNVARWLGWRLADFERGNA